MKLVTTAITIIICLFCGNISFAQNKSKDTSGKKELVISNKGIFMRHSKDTGATVKPFLDTVEDKLWSSSVSVDLGFNMIKDNSNYSDPSIRSFMNVPANRQNASLFDLKQSKSINVNVYPWLETYRLLKTAGQRIYITTGIGLQLYNFRFENPITFTRNPSGVKLDTLGFTKNKLAFDYLHVPLMFTFKTRLYQNKEIHKKDKWLVYGAGVTGGFAISTWTKQISAENGKVKLHDSFGFNPFNACVNGEFGIDGVIRFYASYQLTSMYKSDIKFDQHPISFGIRLSGI